MADIDKSLPNDKRPEEEEVAKSVVKFWKRKHPKDQ